MDLEDKFAKAVLMINTLPAESVQTTTEQKLQIYALYKQAMIGDINISQPWAVQIEARAKWEAWNALKGTSKTVAMEKYIQLLTDITKCFNE